MYVNIKQRSVELRTKHIASSSHRAYVDRARHTVRTSSVHVTPCVRRACTSRRAYVERARHTVRTGYVKRARDTVCTTSAERVRQSQLTFVLVTLVLTSPQ